MVPSRSGSPASTARVQAWPGCGIRPRAGPVRYQETSRRWDLTHALALLALAPSLAPAQQFQHLVGLLPGTPRWTEGVEAAESIATATSTCSSRMARVSTRLG